MSVSLAKLICVAEKAHYPFRAYPKTACREVLFPGCALPSQLPRTTDTLMRACRQLGMGVVFDCCGKPLEDWGEHRLAERALAGLRRRLERMGCERLVLACPNCLHYLQSRLDVPCVSIYQALRERGFRAQGTFAQEGPGVLFTPCPERASRAMEADICALMGRDGFAAAEPLRTVPCCGLRADVAAKGPDFVQKQTRRVFERAGGATIYTYCASCLGQFARMGYPAPARHALSVLLGVQEAPDAAHALLNRARRRGQRGLEPLGTPDAAGTPETPEPQEPQEGGTSEPAGRIHDDDGLANRGRQGRGQGGAGCREADGCCR